MKKISNMYGYLALAAGLLVVITSCVQRLPPREPYEPDNGGSRRPSANTMQMSRAYADYFGSWYNDNTSDFLIYLSIGDTDNEGYFTSSATCLTLDLLSTLRSDKIFEPGNYNCSTSQRVMTFMPGAWAKDDEGDYVDGSSLYIQYSPDEYVTYPVTEGKVTITSQGNGVYKITAGVVADGVEYLFIYTGSVPVTDRTESDPITTDDELYFPGASKYGMKAVAQYNKGFYDNCDDYTLKLYCGEYASGDMFRDKGFEVVFDILTPLSDGGTIKSGTYSCTSSDISPYHFLDGYEEDGVSYPSYFYRQYSNDDMNWALDLIKSGTIYIAKISGEQYSVKAYFNTSNKGFYVNYEGEIEFVGGNAGGQTAQVRTARSTMAVTKSAGVSHRMPSGALSARRCK